VIVDRVLTDGDVAAVAEARAERIAEMVSVPGTFALVDARRLAQDLGVSIDYVYSHATELGAMRLSSARLAFGSISTARDRLLRQGQGGSTADTGNSPRPGKRAAGQRSSGTCQQKDPMCRIGRKTEEGRVRA
jgi:hypothetical protein